MGSMGLHHSSLRPRPRVVRPPRVSTVRTEHGTEYVRGRHTVAVAAVHTTAISLCSESRIL